MLNNYWLILAFWPSRGSGSWSPTFHSRDQGSFAGHWVWNVWWAKWHGYRFMSDNFGFSVSLSFHCVPHPRSIFFYHRRHLITGLGKPLGLQEFEAPRISKSAHENGKVVSPTYRPPLLSWRCLWYSFLLEVGLTPGPKCGRKY
jgi:hypothetical protein